MTTTLQGMRMLAAGRVDLTLDSVDVVNYALRNDDPGLAEKIEFVPGVLVSQNIHMAVGNSVAVRDRIISDFNRIFGETREDSSLAELLRAHVGG